MKSASPLLNLNSFNIIDGFVPDHMHCVALGIAKQFMEYWFNTTGYKYSLSKQSIQKLQETLTPLKYLVIYLYYQDQLMIDIIGKPVSKRIGYFFIVCHYYVMLLFMSLTFLLMLSIGVC